MLLITVSVLHDWSRTSVTDVKCYIKQVILQGTELGDPEGFYYSGETVLLVAEYPEEMRMKKRNCRMWSLFPVPA